MDSAFEHFVESDRARLCGQWREPPTLAQSDIGRELSFSALAAKVPPFQRFIAGHKRMQRAKRGLIEREFSILHEVHETLRTFREVEYLFLIRKLTTAHRHAFEERLHFGEREWIPLQDTGVPDILRQHPVKSKYHPFSRGTGHFPRYGISVPPK